MEKHFVTFYSPGIFVAEETIKPIDSWDVDAACEMARTVLERYNATPYGFRFSTRGRSETDLDSKEVARSNFYWLGGTVEILAQVKARATEKDQILVSNMECNGWDRIITNNNSWKWTAPLDPDDVVLDWPADHRKEADHAETD